MLEKDDTRLTWLPKVRLWIHDKTGGTSHDLPVESNLCATVEPPAKEVFMRWESKVSVLMSEPGNGS